MTFVNDFLVPLVKVIAYISIFGGLAFIILRALWIRYNRTGKYILKYTIFRRKMAEKDVVWCADAIERKMGYWDIKKHLLISGTPKHRIYEMLFIYDKVYKQLEGGKKNEHGRNQTSYRKGKDAKLPEVADETSTRIE